jgi:hypothetical protein
MSINPGTRDDEKGYFFILLFLDEKKQKSFDRTELAKNPKLTLKCFNSSHTPKTFLNALTADFLYANYVMSGNANRPLHDTSENPAGNCLTSTGRTE